LILHTAEYKCADNGVDAVIRKRQVIRSFVSQVELHSASGCLSFEIRIHEVVGLNANPSNAVFRKVLKIGASAWSNFEYSAREFSKELSFVVCDESLVLRIVRKRPRKRTLPPSTCPAIAFLADHAHLVSFG